MILNENIEITQEDNMALMARYPDNHFDLAVVDPPYGIGGGSNVTLDKKGWDKIIPSKEYFNELVRISKNQIIWGGNYMSSHIPFNSTHTIVWDKENGASFMSDGEIAFTSFDKQTTKFYRLFWMSNMMNAKEKPLIHPTQKPIQLYEWIFLNYAKPNQKILDTHIGSMSIAIALHNVNKKDQMNLSLTACELDEDYFNDGIKRVKTHLQQLTIF